VIYQEWKEEFLQEGEQKGRQEGERSLILRQPARRFGELAPTLQSQIQSLSLSQLESLGEALLDFSQSDDLVNWLRTPGA
jgi:predicted transposase YdaD